MVDSLPILQDDGLITPEVGIWGERKYNLVKLYAYLFSKSMVDKWDCRVYIDLFAGPGRARIKSTKRLVLTSPVLALNSQPQFDKYIFCDSDHEKIEALKQRISRDFPDANVKYIEGDSNKAINSIMTSIPFHRNSFRVLTFCFIDPYKLNNLQFETIRTISRRRVDFMVLIPAFMDGNRNQEHYLDSSNRTIEKFLGLSSWREDWYNQNCLNLNFGHFIAHKFGMQMQKMDYIYGGLDRSELIRNPDKNTPMYYLSFFSKSKLAMKFWEDTKKYTNPQLSLFDHKMED